MLYIHQGDHSWSKLVVEEEKQLFGLIFLTRFATERTLGREAVPFCAAPMPLLTAGRRKCSSLAPWLRFGCRSGETFLEGR